MRKRWLCILAAILMLQAAASAQDGTMPARVMQVGEVYRIRTDRKGEWTSDAPDVASVSGDGLVTAMGEGEAALSLRSGKKILLRFLVDVTTEPPVPDSIRRAIDLALQEWEEFRGKAIARSNKYTAWYYGPKASFGWCGAFTAFALDQAGVPQAPTDTYRKLKPLTDGSPYAVREAAVPKLLTGFSNLDRISNLPRPGYLVIYGRRGGYGTVHVGLVTRSEHRGGGVYLLETVEGNLASRIKRLSFLYDSNAADPMRNMLLLPEDQQILPDVFQYPLSSEEWRITAFAQTWY